MVDIVEFGAEKGAVCTAAIQAAIDAMTAQGGGQVVIPAGLWITGTIELKSGVELHLSTGAILQGSDNLADYRQKTEVAGEYGGSASGFLIIADECDNIAITGLGTIDGRGLHFMDGFRSRGPISDWPKNGARVALV